MINVNEIAKRVKVCTLKTGAWRPVRLHKKATAETNAQHQTNAAEVRVRVCDHSALAELQKLHTEAYTAHKRITRPTVDDGVRLLPCGREFEHAAEMSAFKTKADVLVSTFMNDYLECAQQAPIKLNGLYDASMWPGKEAVANKFRFEIAYRPCPTEGTWAEWIALSAEGAQAELREQLETALRRMAERCGSDGKLYATVFDGLRDIIALVPDLNLANDVLIAQVAKEAAELTSWTAKEVVNAPEKRKAIAAEANRLASMFGGMS